MALEAVIEEAPHHGAERGGDHGIPDGKDGAQVGAKCRTAVEAQPSEPEQEGCDGVNEDMYEYRWDLLPSPTIDTLCGLKFSSSFCCLRPNTQEYARPPTPLPISTGPPPTRIDF